MTDCIFCKIIKGELPSKIVYRDKDVVAFYDINPKAPVHILVVPVKHIVSLQNIGSREGKLLGTLLIRVEKVAQKLCLSADGYKVVINNGRSAGQLIDHLHVHLLGGWKKSPDWEV